MNLMIDLLFTYKIWLLWTAPFVAVYIMGAAVHGEFDDPVFFFKEFGYLLIPIIGHVCGLVAVGVGFSVITMKWITKLGDSLR